MELAASGVKRIWPDEPGIKAAADPATILGLPPGLMPLTLTQVGLASALIPRRIRQFFTSRTGSKTARPEA